jgi:uncharacterized membrane-anchored protein YhcB (DUF1043 family)
VSIEIWILLLVGVAAVAAAVGYAIARRNAPSEAELEALREELAGARSDAEAVQSSVNEHFEQSAVLFGKLAKDYREFLEHFSTSAQELGLSEGRARELLEQGFQPLLTHEAVIDAAVPAPEAEGTAEAASAQGRSVEEASAEEASAEEASVEELSAEEASAEQTSAEKASEQKVAEKKTLSGPAPGESRAPGARRPVAEPQPGEARDELDLEAGLREPGEGPTEAADAEISPVRERVAEVVLDPEDQRGGDASRRRSG